MRTFLMLVGAIVLGGIVGYAIGNAIVTSDELDEVAELTFWTVGGASIGLVVMGGTIAAARSNRGRDDI